MKTIAILSQKGGAGKTTIALNLAVAAQMNGTQTAVIDLDPQASAASWHDSREEKTPVVVSAQPTRLPQVLEAAREASADLVIIDTAPHSESASLAAARAADLVLIPCRPAILDLRAIDNTIDLAKIAGKPAVVVLNAVPPRGSLAQEAAEAVARYGVTLSPTSIGQRAAFVHSLTAGKTVQEYEPDGKAAGEISELYTWICYQVDM
jgi:chromosome partitioning protein